MEGSPFGPFLHQRKMINSVNSPCGFKLAQNIISYQLYQRRDKELIPELERYGGLDEGKTKKKKNL